MTIIHPFPPRPFMSNDPDDDDLFHRRIREHWHTIEWTSREDDRVDPTAGHRIWPKESGAMMYDEFLDWILNGCDNLTFQEWEAQNRPSAVHKRLSFGPSKVDASSQWEKPIRWDTFHEERRHSIRRIISPIQFHRPMNRRSTRG